MGDARVLLGLVPANPQQLGRREAGQRTVAGELDQAVQPYEGLDLLAFGAGALVVPQDRGADHRIGGVERHQSVHLPREPDSRHLTVHEPVERYLRCAPPVLRVLLGPARVRHREPIAGFAPREHLAVLADGDRLDGARPDVEPDRRAHQRTPSSTSTTSWSSRSFAYPRAARSSSRSASALRPSPSSVPSTVASASPDVPAAVSASWASGRASKRRAASASAR